MRGKHTITIADIMVAGSWVEKTRAQLIKEWIVTHILGRKLTDKMVQMKRFLLRRKVG